MTPTTLLDVQVGVDRDDHANGSTAVQATGWGGSSPDRLNEI